MPAAKVIFKKTVLDLELENVEFTVGPEIMKVGKLRASLDIADLLRVQLPQLRQSNADGIMFLSFGQKKIHCIKEIKGMTNWSLIEAKQFVESAPILLKNTDLRALRPTSQGASTGAITLEEAHRLLSEAGAKVENIRSDAPTPTVLDKLREMLVDALREHAK